MDYEKLGFKCGIEIHQQLEGKKLFCSCPTMITDEKPDAQYRRKLRAVVGETGEIDAAARAETLKGKHYIYDYYDSCNCLVELDEEPPGPMNKEALRSALTFARLLDARPVDEIQVMRKTVVDGSNTSGFQRTALVAMDGTLKTEFGPVGIPTVCLEEDAAKIVQRTNDFDEYNLSRLGIPLIEVATDPDIRSPDQVRAVAEKLGLILRSLPNVKRGLGTIRQDVNVSIKGGNRIEIKGAQDLRMLKTLVEYESERQENLIQIKKDLKHQDIPEKIMDVSEIFSGCESKVILSALKKGGAVMAISLPGFAGFLGIELCPGRRLGTEFSDYAKAAAGVGGIFHSDELPRYGIEQTHLNKIRATFKAKEEDGIILVADTRSKAESALKAVIRRAAACKKGVLREVRRANPDGTSSYMRPMPGGARMYPETDVVPEVTKSIKIELPELIDSRIRRYIKTYGMSKDLAEAIARSTYCALFEKSVKAHKNLKAAYIAETLISAPREIFRDEKIDISGLPDECWTELFTHLDKGAIPKESAKTAMIDMKKGSFSLESYKGVDDKVLEKEIKKIIEANKGASFGALMGEVMKEFRGKADGKTLSSILKKLM
jgi:glutamyl-tRNA(Gln) amidotransferase subunit E